MASGTLQNIGLRIAKELQILYSSVMQNQSAILSHQEKKPCQFSGSSIFPNKILNLFVFIFVPSWLHIAAAFSKCDSSQYSWLTICPASF